MTRLVRRHMGGGMAWAEVGNKALQLGKTWLESYFAKEKAKEQKKEAIANAQAEQARADSRMFMAEAARAAEQYDRGGNSSIMGLVNSASRVRDDLTYHSDVGIPPSYQAASQVQTQPAVASSGALTGVVSSFLNRKEEPQQQVEQQQKPALTGTVEAQSVEAQGEEKPAVTGEVASSEPKTAPTGASTDEKSLKEQQEKTKKAAVSATTASAKDGCKLKKRFNPRQFKKQK